MNSSVDEDLIQSFFKAGFSGAVSSELPPSVETWGFRAKGGSDEALARNFFKHYFEPSSGFAEPNLTKKEPLKPPVADISNRALDSTVSKNAISRNAIVDQPEPTRVEVETTTDSLLDRLKVGLRKSRQHFGKGLLSVWSRGRQVSEVLEDIESQLLMADVGIEAADQILMRLRNHSSATLSDPDELRKVLKEILVAQLTMSTPQSPLRGVLPCLPYLVLMVGVNGVGKTTTIAKLAARALAADKTVLLAAGDTFRAAAIEQLQTWADRHKVSVVAQQAGADSASVIFDAFAKAKAKGVDLVFADTAGRLHNKGHLMAELEKIARVLKKQDEKAPHLVLLVLDATTGQNAVNQAEAFHQSVPLSGIVLTKMDGTAKGGIAFALVEKLKVPIWYIGIGEQAEDLREFNPELFVEALLS